MIIGRTVGHMDSAAGDHAGRLREQRRDKRLAAVETLLHERTGRPLVNPDPDPA